MGKLEKRQMSERDPQASESLRLHMTDYLGHQKAQRYGQLGYHDLGDTVLFPL
jgi:hypothetical protein